MKKIFISDRHADEDWKDRVNKHLKVLQMEGISRTWDDRQIPAGTDWEKELFSLIETAGFLASDYIRDKEVPLILDRREHETRKTGDGA
jgi:hypothetical protein